MGEKKGAGVISCVRGKVIAGVSVGSVRGYIFCFGGKKICFGNVFLIESGVYFLGSVDWV